MPARRGPDWSRWLESWDRQQASFNPDRERRFEAMFETARALLPARFTAIDLGCGPGSLSARLLRAFPRARVAAVDFDPVVLRIGREALGTVGGRLAWVDADLRRPGWSKSLPFPRADAAFSTTALHWLSVRELGALYRELARRLRTGGLLLNGDYLPWARERRALRGLSEAIRRARPYGTAARRWGPWNRWWRSVTSLPELSAEVRERARRVPPHRGHAEEVPLEAHERALRRAGFREVAVVWQDVDNRVLLAIR